MRGISVKMGIKEFIRGKIEKRRAFNEEVSKLTDKELKRRAAVEGGKWADAWVARERRKRELKDRIKNRNSLFG